MNIEVIDNNLQFDIYGFSDKVNNKDYVARALQLMDKMWEVVNSNGLKNKGRNIWVYESDYIFTGVELEQAPGRDLPLEKKNINLSRYAYFKHIGSYNLIKESVHKMIAELNKQGLTPCDPNFEIYGHWTDDESKLETELFMCVK